MPGDQILAADGHALDSKPADLSKVIDAAPARDERARCASCATGTRSPCRWARSPSGRRQDRIIGVLVLADVSSSRSRIDVDTSNISGPSAGLAMTLAIIDDLTPGDLTGGKRVAVTGTISPDGTVGQIGAIEQKAVTAKAAHAQIFIVPACARRSPRARTTCSG